jgi:hypothetical protein
MGERGPGPLTNLITEVYTTMPTQPDWGKLDEEIEIREQQQRIETFLERLACRAYFHAYESNGNLESLPLWILRGDQERAYIDDAIDLAEDDLYQEFDRRNRDEVVEALSPMWDRGFRPPTYGGRVL